MKPEGLRKILLEIPGEYRLIFITAGISGLRRGELMGLQWRDFDEEEQSLAIVRTSTTGEVEEPKTENSIRTLPSRRSGPMLKQHRSGASLLNRAISFSGRRASDWESRCAGRAN